MSDKVYCYPDSAVLVNKLNIKDIDRLYEAERRITMLRLDDFLSWPRAGTCYGAFTTIMLIVNDTLP